MGIPDIAAFFFLLFYNSPDPNVALTFLEKTREKVFLKLLFLVVHLRESFCM